MKILFLGGQEAPKLYNSLKVLESDVIFSSEKLTLEQIKVFEPEMLISYNYKHIITKDIINAYKNKIINLHISFLPWNKGAHPNFWSFWDNTPKGVTIHYIDEGIDTGDILFQKEIKFGDNYMNLTLNQTYEILQDEIQDFFMNNWAKIKNATVEGKKQAGKGSFHYAKELVEKCKKMDGGGWNITIQELMILKNQKHQRLDLER